MEVGIWDILFYFSVLWLLAPNLSISSVLRPLTWESILVCILKWGAISTDARMKPLQKVFVVLWLGLEITRGPMIWYYHDTWVTIRYYRDIAICRLLRFNTLRFFSPFSTAKHFPKIKLCHHHLFICSVFIRFSITSPDSELLAPSGGLKNQLIFSILIPKKVSLTFQTKEVACSLKNPLKRPYYAHFWGSYFILSYY